MGKPNEQQRKRNIKRRHPVRTVFANRRDCP